MWSLCHALLASSFLAAPNPAPVDDGCLAQVRQQPAAAAAAVPPRLATPAEVVDTSSVEGVSTFTSGAAPAAVP